MAARRCALTLVIVALGVGAGVAVALGVSDRQQPRYRAEASLVVERGTQPLTGSPGLIRTIRDLARSATVAQAVITNLALRDSTDDLRHQRPASPSTATRPCCSSAPTQPVGDRREGRSRRQFGPRRDADRSPALRPGRRSAESRSRSRCSTRPTRFPAGSRRTCGTTSAGARSSVSSEGLLAANAGRVRGARRKLVVEAPPLLGEVSPGGGFDRVATEALLELGEEAIRSRRSSSRATAMPASRSGSRGLLGERGETAAWALAATPTSRRARGARSPERVLLVAATRSSTRGLRPTPTPSSRSCLRATGSRRSS